MNCINRMIVGTFFGCVFAVALQAADAARERVGNPIPRRDQQRFTFSDRRIDIAYDKKSTRKHLSANLKIECAIDKRYAPPKGETYFLTYEWQTTWKEIQKRLEVTVGLAPERQFLYTHESKRINSLPAFYLHLKSRTLADKTLFLYDVEREAPLLQIPPNEISSDDEVEEKS